MSTLQFFSPLIYFRLSHERKANVFDKSIEFDVAQITKARLYTKDVDLFPIWYLLNKFF